MHGNGVNFHGGRENFRVPKIIDNNAFHNNKMYVMLKCMSKEVYEYDVDFHTAYNEHC